MDGTFIPARWHELARFTPLALALDFDGTLVPLEDTPEIESPSPKVLELLEELIGLGVTLAVVSGRPREALEKFFAGHPRILLVAEHGGHRREHGAWVPALELDGSLIEALEASIAPLIVAQPRALTERKTWTLAIHYRRVPKRDRAAFVVELQTEIDAWLEGRADYECVAGHDVFEVRPRRLRKSSAIAWLRGLAGAGVRVIAVGDDVTDEDMFRVLGADDEAVVVGTDRGRVSAARHQLDDPPAVERFLRALADARRDPSVHELVHMPELRTAEPLPEMSEAPFRLLVISNRLPELRSRVSPDSMLDSQDGIPLDGRARTVGGVVSALEPLLTERQGVWLGWSGRVHPEADGQRYGLQAGPGPTLAWLDFPERWHRHYYNGFCNRALWPLLHSFPARARFSNTDYDAYREAQDAFAESATRLIGRDGTVWVHDYHLLGLAAALRRKGHRGPIGLFLHTPFPSADLFSLLPWANDLLDGMLAFDLVGFHVSSYAFNFRQSVARLLRIPAVGNTIEHGGRSTRIGVFPLGMWPDGQRDSPDLREDDEVRALLTSLGSQRLVLGVDRLDYTKGIPGRLEAFGRMLEAHPEWHRKVALVQVSVPSSGDVPEYAEQRALVEEVVARVNDGLGTPDWVPIRFIYRSFGREQLAKLYRAAHVGYVAPLRDGMNLVSKEFIAAQEPTSPGVLLLSRFAGAAEELEDAVLTNPWHIDGMAEDLCRVLDMPLEERRRRHERLLAVVERTTATSWARDYLAALTAVRKV